MVENKPVHEAETAPVVVPQHPHHNTTNGLAIASMVVGIVAFISGWVPFWGLLSGATAIVLGILALKKPNGKGFSIAGIVTGGIAALTSLFFTAFFIIALVTGGSYINEVQNQVQEETSENQQMIDAKKDFARGETATFGTLEVTVNFVQSGYNPESEYYQAEEGKEYVVVNLTVKNIGDDIEYISPYTFTLNNAGTATANAFVNVEPELSDEDLTPGESTTGNIVFEVEQGAANLKLQYETTVFGSKYEAEKLVYTLAI